MTMMKRQHVEASDGDVVHADSLTLSEQELLEVVEVLELVVVQERGGEGVGEGVVFVMVVESPPPLQVLPIAY